VPPVVQHARGVAAGEADHEGIPEVGDVEILDLAGQRVPVQVADGHVDAAGELGLAEPHPAQVTAGEQHPDRPGPQREHRRGRHGRPGQDDLGGLLTHGR
jgi:hypothetical protein